MYDVPCHAWPDNLSGKRVLRQHLYSILNKNILSKNRKSNHLHGNPFKIYMTSQNSLHNCHYSKSNKILTIETWPKFTIARGKHSFQDIFNPIRICGKVLKLLENNWNLPKLFAKKGWFSWIQSGVLIRIFWIRIMPNLAKLFCMVKKILIK